MPQSRVYILFAIHDFLPRHDDAVAWARRYRRIIERTAAVGQAS